MKIKVLHYNPPDTRGRTRCGFHLRPTIRWTESKEDATCNSCVRFIELDELDAEPPERTEFYA